jgi:phosphohistidine phosphatase
MKSLILVRHAKSSWDIPVIDRDRVLTDQGKLAIQKIAKKAVSFLPKNSTIWSSPASRAKQTALIFCETALLNKESIVFKESLYTFDGSTLEQEIKKCDPAIENLILFGHNEAITNFVNKFGNKFIDNVPTSGFVLIQFENDSWTTINNGKTITTLFPKEITE